MCDSEHMFDCPSLADTVSDDTVDRFNDLEFNQFLQRTMQVSIITFCNYRLLRQQVLASSIDFMENFHAEVQVC